MNYPDSVHFLYALGNEIKTAKFGLDRIRVVLDALGRPQDRLRFIHVAGTNGKGSVCAMLESALRCEGLRTGLYTSPHLAEPTERIRINGEPVSAARFAAAFERVHQVVEGLIAAGAVDMHTTYFETVTAMAMVIFDEDRVDRVVLEVGLGGRLDATNVVTPELCVITPIDFDHEAFLGTSLEAIAREKAGILKEGVPAVFAPQRPEALGVLEEHSAALTVSVTHSREWRIVDPTVHFRGCDFELSNSAKTFHIRCPLAGAHQMENAATAAVALDRIGISRGAIEYGIATVQWPGRLERISSQPEIILDGAHNPAGARALADYIQRFYSGRRVRMIFGAMRDKSLEEIAGILFPLAHEVIVTAPRQSRAFSPEAIGQFAEHPNLRTAPTIESALELVQGVTAEDVVFITGSLFLVAEARALLAGL